MYHFTGEMSLAEREQKGAPAGSGVSKPNFYYQFNHKILLILIAPQIFDLNALLHLIPLSDEAKASYLIYEVMPPSHTSAERLPSPVA